MAATMLRTPFKLLVLLLSICNIAVAQVDGTDALAPRQSPSANAASLQNCQTYARVANLSTVALNSTLRAAFLRSAPMGTFAAISILDTEKPKIMEMMMDAQLNQACGNLTQVAIDGASTNLTNNMILGLPILEAPGVDPGDAVAPVLFVVIFFIFGGTWISL
ncbi:hypothetical protein F4677DRAFT_413903 [Hypoxylon crocopeplum]|nr:hypothetical protein F4677DRAFT_413903 [Hypoxylon crocopeplum]